jgi:hypothetical protein
MRNFGAKKVGGIWFLRVLRLRFSFCVARTMGNSPAASR